MLTRAACECGSWAKTVIIETVTDHDCCEFTSEESSIFYVRDVRNCLLAASDRWRYVLSLFLLSCIVVLTLSKTITTSLLLIEGVGLL